jgi:hypothetical protein
MFKSKEIWQGSGILVYTKDMSDNNSVGFDKKLLKELIQHLKIDVSGFTSISNRIDIKYSFKGVTLSDYQGRHLFIKKSDMTNIVEFLKTL